MRKGWKEQQKLREAKENQIPPMNGFIEMDIEEKNFSWDGVLF